MFKRPETLDVQHHAIPGPYRKALADRGINEVGGVPFPKWSENLSLSMMNAWNIRRAVLSVSCPGVHFGDDLEARKLARLCNDEICGVMARHPERFGGFASLPLPDVPGAIAEYERCVANGPMEGVILMSNVLGHDLGDPSYEPLFERMNEDGALLFVHPNTPPALDGAGLLNAFYGWFLDTTRSLLSMLEAGWPERFSNLRTLAAHGGGVLPAVFGGLALSQPRLATQLEAWRDHLYFDTAKFVNPNAIASLLAFTDPSHVVFSSDFVWAARSKMRYWTANLDRNLPADVLPDVYRGNGTALLRGELRPVSKRAPLPELPSLHVHAVPPALADELERLGVPISLADRFNLHKARAWRTQNGRPGLLLLDVPAIWAFDATTTARLLRAFNEEVAELAQRHPGEFQAIGAIDPRDTAQAVEAIDRCEALGLDGVCVYPDGATAHTTAALGPLLSSRLQRVSGAVVLHPTDTSGAPVLAPRVLDSVLMLAKLMYSGDVDALEHCDLVATHTHGVHTLLADNMGMLHYLRRDGWRMGRFAFDYLIGRQLRGEAFLAKVRAD